MWTASAKRLTTATPQSIWDLWSDVENWKNWDPDVERSGLHGSFQVGTKGFLKPAGGPVTAFTLTECTHWRSFTTRSSLPLCRINFVHMIDETEEGLVLTHQINFSGLLGFLFSRLIGRKAAQGLPVAINQLIALAEAKSKERI